MTTPALHAGQRPAEGLYDPAHEHDACGVGFVVDIKGRKSHAIVRQGHPGPGQPPPPRRLRLRAQHRRRRRHPDPDPAPLPAPGVRRLGHRPCRAAAEYGVGLVFLPRDADAAPTRSAPCCELIVEEEGQQFLGWRDVPTDNSLAGRHRALGRAARSSRSSSAAARRCRAHDAFERKLYVIRKLLRERDGRARHPGEQVLLLPEPVVPHARLQGHAHADQVDGYFPDLTDPDVESALALVHQRFSTNTFPSWQLAHPYRMSRTTARSTPCAATSTGCGPARRSSARELCGDDLQQDPADHPRGAAATRPASTTRSSSSS